jgi:hypothetical protein
MVDQLDRTPWLAGREYSLAEVALLPYTCRPRAFRGVLDVGPSHVRCPMARTLSDARKLHMSIANNLDEHNLALMRESDGQLPNPHR